MSTEESWGAEELGALHVTLVGYAMPEEDFRDLIAVDRGMPAQTQRFGLSLIRALQEGGAEVSLISTPPATTYPHNPNIMFPTRLIEVHNARGVSLGFLNLAVLKHASRTVAVFLRGRKELKLSGASIVLIHGVHSPWLAFGAYASRRLRIPAVAVVTDPPNVPHRFDTKLTLALKNVDQLFVRYLVSKLDGVVALTRSLADDFAPGLPYMIMEGIAPDASSRSPRAPLSRETGPPLVVYAGGLSEEYGVKVLVEAHAIDPSEFRLHIAGRGPLESMLRERAAAEPNLTYLGMVATDELPDLYANADVLVNPRPPNQGFTKYSFPSKILEYMASGRPVVSTRLEGIPEGYGEYLVWADASPRALRSAITRVLGMGRHERDLMGARGFRFVSEQRSAKSQGRRLAGFLGCRVRARLQP